MADVTSPDLPEDSKKSKRTNAQVTTQKNTEQEKPRKKFKDMTSDDYIEFCNGQTSIK